MTTHDQAMMERQAIDQQRKHMRDLIAAYDRVGVAHLQIARDVAPSVHSRGGWDDKADVLASHHRTLADNAFAQASHYDRVMRDFIEKKFNLKKV